MTKKPAAPPAPSAPSALSGAAAPRSPRALIPKAVKLDIESGVTATAHKVLAYGTGGVGKSTAAAYLPAPLFLDLSRDADFLNVARVRPSDWSELRGALSHYANEPPRGVQSFVIDNMTVGELLAREHVVATRTTDKGSKVDSIERFPYGKGWQFFSDEVDGVLMDLDRLVAKGFNVCLIAHETSTNVPNPAGEDWLRWEPDLYRGGKDGRGSTRHRIKGWADHVVYFRYDVHVEDGKGQGSGSRSWYTQELPTHIAKSRTVQTMKPFTIEDPGAVWRTLGITDKTATPQP